MKQLHVISALFLSVLLFAGCSAAPNQVPSTQPGTTLTIESTQPESPSPLFQLQFTVSEKSEIYKAAGTDGEFNQGVLCTVFTDVAILLDGQWVPLKQALHDGLTVNWVGYALRSDSEAGFCTRYAESIGGVTNVYDVYPDYRVRFIDDILECIDGSQQEISSLLIYDGSCEYPPSSDLFDENMQPLNLPDQGLTWEVVDVTPSNVTLSAVQSGGFLRGQLQYVGFLILNSDGIAPEVLDQRATGSQPTWLETNGSTRVELDFTDEFGELPSGSYTLLLEAEDVYDKTQVYPLLNGLRTVQFYEVPIEIP